MKSLESPLVIKDKFLNNETIQETSHLPTDCEIDSGDEVWMLQCPQSIEIDALINRKLKLPGKARHEHIQTVANKFPEAQIVTLATRSKREYKLRNISLQGYIVVREKKRKETTDPDPILVEDEDEETVKFPSSFKARHPFLGADFKDKLELAPEILARLKEANQSAKKHKKKRLRTEIKTESISDSIKAEPCNEEAGVHIKKEKKKNRQADDSFQSLDESSIKRLKKNKNVDNNHTDLDWIKQF